MKIGLILNNISFINKQVCAGYVYSDLRVRGIIMDYDAIVIGGGLSGLTAAGLLAKEDYQLQS